jgi:Bacteriocin-protection, YdeI or OmpD-Associated/Domain of unknown function (DUF1905)
MTKPTPNPLRFNAKLTGRGPGGAWTFIEIPFSVLDLFGRKGQVPVRATLNGFAYRNSLIPRGGVHILGVGKDVLAVAGAVQGDTVQVELALDDALRTVTVPADLEAALASASAGQAETFAALSYSHKKEFVDWIESAKKPETRAARIEKTLIMIAAKRAPKG